MTQLMGGTMNASYEIISRTSIDVQAQMVVDLASSRDTTFDDLICNMEEILIATALGDPQIVYEYYPGIKSIMEKWWINLQMTNPIASEQFEYSLRIEDNRVMPYLAMLPNGALLIDLVTINP